MDKMIRDEHLRHVPLNGDALEVLGISREDGDEIARELNLGATHYPNGTAVSWQSLSESEQRSAASWCKRTHPTPPPRSVTREEVEKLVDAAKREVVSSVLDAITADLTDLFGKRDATIKAIDERVTSKLAEYEISKNVTAGVVREHNSRFRELESQAGHGGATPAQFAELKSKLAALEERQFDAYQGVWKENTRYERGQFCTHDGSMWACLRRTRDQPPSSNWQLAVKRGRDARER